MLGEGESEYDALNQLRQVTDEFLRATFHQPSRLPAGPKKGHTGLSMVEARLQRVAPSLHYLLPWLTPLGHLQTIPLGSWT